jgi:hypothetical protein
MPAVRELPPWVYFLRRADGVGPVKIGCSQRPEDRLSNFMQWSPYPLQIVARLLGDESLERRFHAQFSGQHSHREWFHPSPELIRVIDELRAGNFDTAALPPAKALSSYRPRAPWTPEQRQGAVYSHRLNHLRIRGVLAPEAVTDAAWRWRSSRYTPGAPIYDPADAAIVEAFLALHPPLARRKAA